MKEQNKNSLDDYARYTAIPIELIVIILLFTWIGHQIDQKVRFEIPIFTVLLAIIGIGIGLYVALKSFLHKKQDK